MNDRQSNLSILDNNDEIIATVTEYEPLNAQYENEKYSAYVEYAIENAIEFIESEDDCSREKAIKLLFKASVIKTSFDRKIFDSCDSAYNNSDLKNAAFSFAMTDLNGSLLCIYSSDKDTNYATKKTQPYSSFKPLSVYAPALEDNIINWSSVFPDKPIKQIMSSDGEYADWPVNPNKKYAYDNVTIADGIKYSLNTTAVNCLMKFGVKKSVDFLSDNFGINLEHEIDILNSVGEDEILADIGLGYLTDGVSAVDMAGYYQIFANGGKYIKPSCVTEILNYDNKVMYTCSKSEKQVISEDTAFVMNQLLQNTLSDGGTAENAKYNNIEIGGKTGTGDKSVDNWFVGFCPQYSFSVWHGSTVRGVNECASLVPKILKGVIFDESKRFPSCNSVGEAAYCADTGDLLSLDCSSMGVGFYKKGHTPEKCDGLHR